MSDSRLKARRRLRALVVIVVALIVAVVIADRAGAFGYRGDDYARFDRARVNASNIISGDTFLAASIGEVHLLGADASAKHWSVESKRYLEARLRDRSITLKLDGTQTRDEQGLPRTPEHEDVDAVGVVAGLHVETTGAVRVGQGHDAYEQLLRVASGKRRMQRFGGRPRAEL